MYVAPLVSPLALRVSFRSRQDFACICSIWLALGCAIYEIGVMHKLLAPYHCLGLTMCLVFMVLCCTQSLAQRPKLSLQAGVGTWWPYAKSGEVAYMTFSDWGLGTKSVGTMLDLAPRQRFSFAPMVSLELFRRRFQVSSSNWLEASNLHLLHLRISPGLRIKLSEYMNLRIGLAVQFLGLAWGNLMLTLYNSNPEPNDVNDYSSNSGNQLNRFTFGPDLQFSVSIPMGKAGALEPGIFTYASLNRSVPRSSPFHFEPGIWQIGLQMGYVFPSSNVRDR